MTSTGDAGLDLHSIDLDGDDAMALGDGFALGTYSTTSTAGTASCPVSSAGSVMTAASAS